MLDGGIPPSARAFPGRLTSSATRLLLDWARDRGVERALHEALVVRKVDLVALAKSRWVGFGEHLEALDAARGLLDSALWDLGAYNALHVERVVPGANLLLRVTSPRRLIQSAPLLWRTYADFGEVRVLAARSTGGRIAVAGYPAHPHFCETMAGFFGGLLARVGAHASAVEHTECMSRRAGACVFTGTWT